MDILRGSEGVGKRALFSEEANTELIILFIQQKYLVHLKRVRYSFSAKKVEVP